MKDIINTTFTGYPRFREATYFYRKDLTFRVKLKRNYLFALWASRALGYTGQTAENYIKELTIAELKPFSSGTLLPKVLATFHAAQIGVSESRIRKAFDQCWETAYKMVMTDEETL